MKTIIGLFQTAEGAVHWPTVLTFSGWVLAGALMFAGFTISRGDRLKAGPWVFTAKQEAAFLAALGSEPKGNVAIEYTSADEKRGFEFAMKLKSILETAGYDVWGHVAAFVQSHGSPITGVQVWIKRGTPSDATGAILQRAFKAAGIEADGIISPNNNYTDDRALILIGKKP